MAKETTKETSKTTKSSSNLPVSQGTGRRKAAIARVWLRRGKGNMNINGIPYAKYFDTDIARLEAGSPFKACEEANRFDIEVNVVGGGKKAQADAVKLGFARALISLYENLRPILRQHNLLTVDSRVKERKKYGQKAARRKFQFVKR